MTIDQNTRDVVIALVTVAGGFLTAVVVTQIGAGQSRRLERDRWRRELYASLMRNTEELRDAARDLSNGDEPDDARIEEARRGGYQATMEIRLVAPRMRGPTDALHHAAVWLFSRMCTGPTSQWGELDECYVKAYQAFIEAARKDLG